MIRTIDGLRFVTERKDIKKTLEWELLSDKTTKCVCFDCISW